MTDDEYENLIGRLGTAISFLECMTLQAAPNISQNWLNEKACDAENAATNGQELQHALNEAEKALYEVELKFAPVDIGDENGESLSEKVHTVMTELCDRNTANKPCKNRVSE